MAGIGFLLRKLNPHQSFGGLARVYGAAGVISSGPWLISILGILLIGLWVKDEPQNATPVVQFQVSVTWLFAGSLILTGILQFIFTRFIADRIFEKKADRVAPNLMGVLGLTTLVSGLLAAMVVLLGFGGEPLLYRVAMVAGFVLMSDIWMVVVLLSGLKAYRTIVLFFALGYGVTVSASLGLRGHGLSGLLVGFLLGQALLFFGLLGALLRDHPAQALVRLDFLERPLIHPSLAVTGLLYNLAIWSDKLVFWLTPSVSEQVVGPLRASVVYDVPIFLAYLTIAPGMAVFLVRMETDFAELYDAFYDMVRQGATLESLERTRDNMIITVRQGIYEIFKVQGLTLAVVVILGPRLLAALGISPLYLPLFYIDTVAVAAQVLFLAILNVLFYLDQRRLALILAAVFLVLNLGLTLLTIQLGPSFYGYGFAIAAGAVCFLGLGLLSRRLALLVQETFMLQSVAS